MSKKYPKNSDNVLKTIRCDNCGEDYSQTYKRCPFCNERHGGMMTKKYRGDGQAAYGRNPLQMIGFAACCLLIAVALFIIFKMVAPLLSPSNPQTETINPGTSTGQTEIKPSTGTQTPSNGEETTPGTEQEQPPVTNPVVIQAVSLSKREFTLEFEGSHTLTAAVSPANTNQPVTWSSSDPTVLAVDENGTATNKNTTGKTVVATITATCGGMSAECKVYCRSGASSSGAGESTGGGAAVSGRTQGTVTASGGLNIRSGPGSGYDVIASASYGSSVVILENAGDGWYKIDYGNGKIGYASSNFIKPK